MGLRGPKQSVRCAERERRVWRAYLLHLALGYVERRSVVAAVARTLGIGVDTAHTIVQMTSPDGCYERS